MATQQMGALAAAAQQDEQYTEAAPQAGPAEPSLEAAADGQQSIDPQVVEAVQLVVARAMDVLSGSSDDLRAALMADPIEAAVEFGTKALRAVAGAAEQAGQPLPFVVVINAGAALLQIIATLAADLGSLDEAGIETFLKEAFQQSVQAYARMDKAEGRMTDEDVGLVASAAQGGA